MKARLVLIILLLFALSGAVVDAFRLQPGNHVDAILPPPLPVAVKEADDQLLQDAIAAYLWDPERGENRRQGAASTAGGQVDGAVNCSLKGIYYGQVYQPLAMFACADQPLKAWKEGETLPNQAMLAEIQADHVVMEKDGEQQNVFLFGKK